MESKLMVQISKVDNGYIVKTISLYNNQIVYYPTAAETSVAVAKFLKESNGSKESNSCES